MVMGFNTEVEYNGVKYHIQTEPRKDAGIETTIYLRGAVVHSIKSSHRDLLGTLEYSEEKLRRLVEDQHRQVIARLRAGEISPPAIPIAPP
jgi:hypothetical protein